MPETTWNHALEHVSRTDVGLRRANNQDAMAVMVATDETSWSQRGHVFLVADGMGAHAAGELASKLAADGIPHTYSKLRDQAPPDAIRRAIVETNSLIHGRGKADAEFHGMGTTCSVLLILPQGALVAHVGDSRVYRLRGERIEQLTFDHSLVWEMMAAGQVSGNERDHVHIPKNIITRSLGPNPDVKVDLEGPFSLEVGDRFLLCSDGLSGQVTDEEIGAILRVLPLDEATEVLIDLANLRGGPDNITVVAVHVTGEQLTRAAGVPFTIPSEKPTTRVHPALWGVAGVCLFAALVLGLMEKTMPAILALAGGVVAAAMGIIQRLGDRRVRGYVVAGGQLGQGPHRAYDAKADEAVVAGLAAMADQLRDAAQREPWNVDWRQFDALEKSAAAAAEKGQFDEALADHGRAIRLMMGQLRQQRDRAAEA